MDFSVAICTWNRAGQLRRTLESLESLRLRSSASWEVLVINNASTDDTERVIEQFGPRLPIRGLYEGRQGKSAALNRGLSEFKGAKLIWTDDDVIADPDWVEAIQVSFEQSGADVVFGRSYPVWPGPQPSWYGPNFMGQFAILDYGAQPFVVTTPEHPYYGLNVAFTRRGIERLGPYREDLGYVGAKGGAGEDTEMFERALASGLKILYEPAALVGHCIPPERTTKKRQRQLAWQGARTNYILIKQQALATDSWLGIPRYMFRLALEDGWIMVKASARRELSECFYREVRLWRFVGLLREALRQRTAVPR